LEVITMLPTSPSSSESDPESESGDGPGTTESLEATGVATELVAEPVESSEPVVESVESDAAESVEPVAVAEVAPVVESVESDAAESVEPVAEPEVEAAVESMESEPVESESVESDAATDSATPLITASSLPPAPPSSSLPPPPPNRRTGVVVGKVVEVTVTTATDKEVEVRLADGSTGVIERKEFDQAPPVGGVIPAALLAREDPRGRIVLSYDWAKKQRAWEAVEAAKASGTALTGTVTKVVKGGAVVDLGLRAFLPLSMIDDQPGTDPATLVGTQIEVMVMEVERSADRLVVSRRDLIRKRRRAAEKEVYSTLQPGATVPGKVVSLADYGAVVDLGGIRGLIHRSELTWGHLGEISDVVTVGQDVQVKVLDVNRSKKRVSLSLRQIAPDPLATLEEGAVLPATVIRVVEYGCFVRLDDSGAEGLVHQSELTDLRDYRPDQLVSPGETVMVKVMEIDRKRRRLNLSVRRVLLEG